jgi:hypothetical protein
VDPQSIYQDFALNSLAERFRDSQISPVDGIISYSGAAYHIPKIVKENEWINNIQIPCLYHFNYDDERIDFKEQFISMFGRTARDRKLNPHIFLSVNRRGSYDYGEDITRNNDDTKAFNKLVQDGSEASFTRGHFNPLEKDLILKEKTLRFIRSGKELVTSALHQEQLKKQVRTYRMVIDEKQDLNIPPFLSNLRNTQKYIERQRYINSDYKMPINEVIRRSLEGVYHITTNDLLTMDPSFSREHDDYIQLMSQEYPVKAEKVYSNKGRQDQAYLAFLVNLKLIDEFVKSSFLEMNDEQRLSFLQIIAHEILSKSKTAFDAAKESVANGRLEEDFLEQIKRTFGVSGLIGMYVINNYKLKGEESRSDKIKRFFRPALDVQLLQWQLEDQKKIADKLFAIKWRVMEGVDARFEQSGIENTIGKEKYAQLMAKVTTKPLWKQAMKASKPLWQQAKKESEQRKKAASLESLEFSNSAEQLSRVAG